MKFHSILKPETPYNRASTSFISLFNQPNIYGDFRVAVKFSIRDNSGMLTEEESSQIDDMNHWCGETFGDSNFVMWVASSLWIFMRDDEHLLRFKLRWC